MHCIMDLQFSNNLANKEHQYLMRLHVCIKQCVFSEFQWRQFTECCNYVKNKCSKTFHLIVNDTDMKILLEYGTRSYIHTDKHGIYVHYAQNYSTIFGTWKLVSGDRNKLPISEMWTFRRCTQNQNDKASVKCSTGNANDAKGTPIQHHFIVPKIGRYVFCMWIQCTLLNWIKVKRENYKLTYFITGNG